MKIAYIDKTFRKSSMTIIAQCEAICDAYAAQGFTLTLRQLYYQGVSRALWVNSEQSYDRLGAIVNDARLAGLLDWDHIEDRTRSIRSNAHWISPKQIIGACATSYAIDKWNRQAVRPYVLIEKDALVGVIEGVCQDLDVPYFSCRGFSSVSALRDLAMRMVVDFSKGREQIVFHLGDHDPSGIDMTRDIEARLALFCEHHRAPAPKINRLALNMDQITLYNPPPNPAKQTDSRFAGYALAYGEESWELDALDPNVIATLIRDNVEAVRDDALWDEAVEEENDTKMALGEIRDNYSDVVEWLRDNDSDR